MMAGMWLALLLGVVLLALMAWTTVGASSRSQPVTAKVRTAEEVLRGRLERGEISTREFEHAMRQLRDS